MRRWPVGANVFRGIGWHAPPWQSLVVTLLIPLMAVVALPPRLPGPLTQAPATTASVLVIGAPGSDVTVAEAIRAVGGRLGRHLAIINGYAAQVPSTALGRLAAMPGVRSVGRNAPATAQGNKGASMLAAYDAAADPGSMYSTGGTIGARSLWSQGFTGKGIDIALIDSGVAPVEGLSTPGKVINGPDLSEESQGSTVQHLDSFGHGTHMAGIIAGRDTTAVSGSYGSNSTDFLGMAPDARILNLKVADAHGATDVSQVIAAIDWIVQHRTDNGLNVRIINLSYGTDSSQPYTIDPLAYAAEVAWQKGIVVVAAAGNASATSTRLNNPASDPFVIAVGAVDATDSHGFSKFTVPGFSSAGSSTRTPDLVAPGAHIQSLRVPGSYVDQTFGATGTISPRFFRGSGTSQSTAVTSGAAALLLQKNPYLTPDQVKHALTSTAVKVTRSGPSVVVQGSGAMVALASAATAPLGSYKQTFVPSTGTGLLDAARGTNHVAQGGVTLSGEKDIFGKPFNAAAMAAVEALGTSWSGGVWSGTSWSGTSWSGISWSGTSWSGTSWSGTSWSGTSWSGTSWSGTSWSGTSWSGTSWSGTSWSGTSWSCGSWVS